MKEEEDRSFSESISYNDSQEKREEWLLPCYRPFSNLLPVLTHLTKMKPYPAPP